MKSRAQRDYASRGREVSRRARAIQKNCPDDMTWRDCIRIAEESMRGDDSGIDTQTGKVYPFK